MDVCFGSYIGAMLIFLGPYYIYIIYIIIGLGIYSMILFYIVFKDIFIFRCVFGLTKKVWDFGQGFKNNIIRP